MGDEAFSIMDNRELNILSFNSNLPGWSELTEKVDQEEELRIAFDMKINMLVFSAGVSKFGKDSFFFKI